LSDYVFLADSDAKLCQVKVFGNGGLTCTRSYIPLHKEVSL